MVSNLFKTTYKKHEFQQIFKEQKPIFRSLNLNALSKKYLIINYNGIILERDQRQSSSIAGLFAHLKAQGKQEKKTKLKKK
jgi:hypothetical protein